jgi:hypothetical protein
MKIRPLVVLASILAAAPLLLAFPVSAAAQGAVPTESDPAPSGSVTWALRPAAQGEADGRVSFRHTVDPGAGIDESLIPTNFSPDAAGFAVYASDGTVTGEGSFDLIPAQEESTGSGTWIDLGVPEGAQARSGSGFTVEVPAQSSIIIPVRIDVPTDASPGDHPAGIVAELMAGDDAEVHVASRIGVRLHLRVSGDVEAGARPDIVEVGYAPSWNPFAPGILTVRYDIENTGNVRVGTESAVRVSGPLGALPADAPADLRREILPGDRAAAEAVIPVWPLFLSEVRATVDPASVGEDEVDATITSSTQSTTVWTIPWAQLALVLAIVLLILAIRRSRARAAARMQTRIDAAVATARAETVAADPS